LEDDEAEQLKNNELKTGSIYNKDCNDIFDKGHYICGSPSSVGNWPFSVHGMLIVFNGGYTVQITIVATGMKYRFNDQNKASAWTNWKTII
jgi:hypothetical protein